MDGAYRWVADECEVYELPPRYRPESVSSLCRVTRFSEEEVKRLYRGFKAECPSGVIREDTFKIIYSQFFSARGKYNLEEEEMIWIIIYPQTDLEEMKVYFRFIVDKINDILNCGWSYFFFLSFFSSISCFFWREREIRGFVLLSKCTFRK